MKALLIIQLFQIINKTDQVYSNTRVPTQVNTSQHQATRINTNQ